MRRDRWLSAFIGLALMAAWEAGVRLWQTSALVLPAPSESVTVPPLLDVGVISRPLASFNGMVLGMPRLMVGTWPLTVSRKEVVADL